MTRVNIFDTPVKVEKIVLTADNASMELQSAIIRNDVSTVKKIIYRGLVPVTRDHIYMADIMRSLCGSDYTIVNFLTDEYKPPPYICILARICGIDVDYSDMKLL